MYKIKSHFCFLCSAVFASMLNASEYSLLESASRSNSIETSVSFKGNIANILTLKQKESEQICLLQPRSLSEDRGNGALEKDTAASEDESTATISISGLNVQQEKLELTQAISKTISQKERSISVSAFWSLPLGFSDPSLKNKQNKNIFNLSYAILKDSDEMDLILLNFKFGSELIEDVVIRHRNFLSFIEVSHPNNLLILPYENQFFDLQASEIKLLVVYTERPLKTEVFDENGSKVPNFFTYFKDDLSLKITCEYINILFKPDKQMSDLFEWIDGKEYCLKMLDFTSLDIYSQKKPLILNQLFSKNAIRFQFVNKEQRLPTKDGTIGSPKRFFGRRKSH